MHIARWPGRKLLHRHLCITPPPASRCGAQSLPQTPAPPGSPMPRAARLAASRHFRVRRSTLGPRLTLSRAACDSHPSRRTPWTCYPSSKKWGLPPRRRTRAAQARCKHPWCCCRRRCRPMPPARASRCSWRLAGGVVKWRGWAAGAGVVVRGLLLYGRRSSLEGAASDPVTTRRRQRASLAGPVTARRPRRARALQCPGCTPASSSDRGEGRA